MKKFVTSICIICLLLCGFVVPVSAQDYSNDVIRVVKIENGEIQYFADGSYAEITITQYATRAANTTGGAKTYNYKNSSGEILWTYVLHASFTYNGSSAVCTNAWHDLDYPSNWKLDKNDIYRSGNGAFTDFTMKRYVLGISMQTENKKLELRCSADGSLY